ncbi:MAG: hypothetical protein LBD49_03800 [Oscillospiraceae bacterium]|jgi:hypothetical protein|nr:hypothetical protein [Oscillospiraceae bacterium]
MNTIAVLENSGEGFADAVCGALADVPGVLAVNLAGAAGTSREISCDIVVVSPGYTGGARGSCLALLAPDGRAPTLFDSKTVVTYGMSPCSTLTLSSIGDGRAWLAVQRELMTLGGELVEEQELEITASGGTDASLAAAGGRLLLGITRAGLS